MLVTASFKRTAKEGSDGKMTQWVGAATIKPDVQSFLGSAGLKGELTPTSSPDVHCGTSTPPCLQHTQSTPSKQLLCKYKVYEYIERVREFLTIFHQNKTTSYQTPPTSPVFPQNVCLHYLFYYHHPNPPTLPPGRPPPSPEN